MEALCKSLCILGALFLSSSHFSSAQEVDQFMYYGFRGANLSLSGNANIHSDGLLELTNTTKQQTGHAFFPFPLHFNSSSSNHSQSLSFSTNFVFAIVPESPSLGGHGIAFTISPSVNFTSATATQYLGLFNFTSITSSSNHLLAVEMDTVQNPEFNDINNNHVGIDIDNLTSIQSAPAMYFSEKEGKNISLELVSGIPMQIWIDYHGPEKLLNVTLAPVRNMKPEKSLLSTSVDLSQVLCKFMYVGFSSSTGSVASRHYILGWSFNKSGPAQSLDAAKLPSIPKQNESKERVDLIIVIAFVTGIGLLIAFSGTIYVTRKRYAEVREDWEKQYGPQRFCYKELHKATKGFKGNQLLGSGGFGKVYRGVLPSSNVQVAVKKVSHDSQQGLREFVAEIASMGRLRHRNLVQLLGYCRRKGELFLAYEYMPNGSLDKILFNSEKPRLDWVQRYQILKGVASALLYLHEEWEQVVLHRDVKASNVLLDADLNGRLGDFGLAKFYDHGSAPETTCVVGTVGYLAPELMRTGKATTSSDVFAFGIFMLEVACGRRPIESKRSEEEVLLVEWILKCWKRGEILATGDPRLEGDFVVEEMELVLRLGLLCVHQTPAARPSIRQVVQYLDRNATLPHVPLDSILGSCEVTRTCILPLSTSLDFSSYFLSDSDPIFSNGHGFHKDLNFNLGDEQN